MGFDILIIIGLSVLAGYVICLGTTASNYRWSKCPHCGKFLLDEDQ